MGSGRHKSQIKNLEQRRRSYVVTKKGVGVHDQIVDDLTVNDE